MAKPSNDCFSSSDMLSVADARQKLLDLVEPVADIEMVPLKQALNRIIADDVISRINMPAFDNSAMDGYAVISRDLSSDKPTTLTLAGKSFAGHPYEGDVAAGQCIRIMTGAPMPNDCDAVVMQENVSAEGNDITFQQGVCRGDNVRYVGEDIKSGETILARGHQIRPADSGLMASAGISEAPVFRKLKVAFFSTGDELCSVGTELAHGQIYDSNRYIIDSMLQQSCIEAIDMGVIADDRNAVEAAFKDAASKADVIITSGGVSVGEADYVKEILDKLGQVHFWRVAMKPGKPLAIGSIDNAFFVGLPGNPVSVMATFYQFAQPAIHKMAGIQPRPILTISARTTAAIRKQPGRAEFQRGILSMDDNQQAVVTPVTLQGSHILSSMSKANCFILLDADNAGLDDGSLVTVQPFDFLM